MHNNHSLSLGMSDKDFREKVEYNGDYIPIINSEYVVTIRCQITIFHIFVVNFKNYSNPNLNVIIISNNYLNKLLIYLKRRILVF